MNHRGEFHSQVTYTCHFRLHDLVNTLTAGSGDEVCVCLLPQRGNLLCVANVYPKRELYCLLGLYLPLLLFQLPSMFCATGLRGGFRRFSSHYNNFPHSHLLLCLILCTHTLLLVVVGAAMFIERGSAGKMSAAILVASKKLSCSPPRWVQAAESRLISLRSGLLGLTPSSFATVPLSIENPSRFLEKAQRLYAWNWHTIVTAGTLVADLSSQQWYCRAAQLTPLYFAHTIRSFLKQFWGLFVYHIKRSFLPYVLMESHKVTIH